MPLPACSVMHDPSRADLNRSVHYPDSPTRIIADPHHEAHKSDMYRSASRLKRTATEYNRRSYKHRSPLHTGRWLPMKTREARDMRDLSAPPEVDLATTNEERCRQKKTKQKRAGALLYVLEERKTRAIRPCPVGNSLHSRVCSAKKKTKAPPPIYGNRYT